MATPNLSALNPEEIVLPFYRRPPWVVGLIGFLGLYGVIQFMRVVVEGRPFWPASWVIAVGDPIIAIFMVAAAYAFRGFTPSPPERFKKLHRILWFLWLISIPPVAIAINYLKEGRVNLAAGSPSSVVHSMILVPIFAILVVGVIPQLLFYVKGHWIARYTAIAALISYLVTLALN